MKNWLEQEIEEGDYVYNGQRDGNTSMFRIGRVVEIIPIKTHDKYGDPITNPDQMVRVEWLIERGREWLPNGTSKYVPGAPWAKKSSINIQNLVRVELDSSILPVVE